MSSNHNPELEIFNIHPASLNFCFPAIVPAVAYLTNYLKLWALDEGDLEYPQNFFQINKHDVDGKRKREKPPRYYSGSESSLFEEPREESLSEYLSGEETHAEEWPTTYL